MFSRQQSLDLDEDDSISSGRSRSNSEENRLEYESFGEEEEGEGNTDTEIKEEATEYRNVPQNFSASRKNLIEPRKAAILSVLSRDKRLPFNWRTTASSIKKSPKFSRYFLKPGYYSTICSIKFVRKRSKQKIKTPGPFRGLLERMINL